jgi:hypothetical protein
MMGASKRSREWQLGSNPSPLVAWISGFRTGRGISQESLDGLVTWIESRPVIVRRDYGVEMPLWGRWSSR